MRTARLLVLALLAGAAVAGAALPDPTTAGGGTVTDPQGDAVGAGPDIAAFSVCHTATELQLDVNLFTPWGNDKGVVIDLDVDQNSNTGLQGFEFLVFTFGQQEHAGVLNLTTNHVTGVATVTYGATSVMLRFPLSAIGGDDGVLDALAQVGGASGSTLLISDRAPDASLLASVACGGPVPTTTTLPTTSTTTLPTGSCTGDEQCEDGDACNGVATCDLRSGTCRAGAPLQGKDDLLCQLRAIEDAIMAAGGSSVAAGAQRHLLNKVRAISSKTQGAFAADEAGNAKKRHRLAVGTGKALAQLVVKVGVLRRKGRIDGVLAEMIERRARSASDALSGLGL
ncbi:MAG: hypothetical protein E6J77_06160 [Deltaproteobacteria bacterium]|nr:MAG: hypothetical protein E6J77_06160 [Deltaproteobacteria bacterium]